ncbi:hypothetical protein VTK73DRAFT_1742 [Phialemonium thermophilum]|uniref:Uncharacterized protein n=1 Tax=Phialemonium thermophilum TaxID=223376 RepID=A0ABR3VT02_9PEZI
MRTPKTKAPVAPLPPASSPSPTTAAAAVLLATSPPFLPPAPSPSAPSEPSSPSAAAAAAAPPLARPRVKWWEKRQNAAVRKAAAGRVQGKRDRKALKAAQAAVKVTTLGFD